MLEENPGINVGVYAELIQLHLERDKAKLNAEKSNIERKNTIIKVDGEQAGGMMTMTGPMFEGVPEHWLVYFQVDDCDAAAKTVGETGGTVVVPPMDIPVGRFSVLQPTRTSCPPPAA